jgi:hypothetical protein
MKSRRLGLPLAILLFLPSFLAGCTWAAEPQQPNRPTPPSPQKAAQPPWEKEEDSPAVLSSGPAWTVPGANLTAPTSAWHIETVDSAGDVGESNSLALDAEGHPHISYVDWTNKALKYAYYDGSNWIVETINGAGYIRGGDTSLALDGQGRPHISYCTTEYGEGYCLELRYAYYDGSAWVTETVDGGNIGDGESSSLALDAEDRPHISYHAGGGLRYAYHDGTAWITETLESGHTVGGATSLVLDAAGRPRISYFQMGISGQLRYAYRDEQGWHVEHVYTTGHDARGNSLALDSAGRPRISFQKAGPLFGGLSYAYLDGQAWHIEDLDGDVSSYTGADCSLKLDAADRPHISYYFLGSGYEPGFDLRYAHYDGTAWITETVDAGGDVGSYTSLALDSSGRPHISYYDATHGDLRYAYRCAPVGEVVVSGSALFPLRITGLYSATYQPPTASLPITFAWSNGAVGPTAAYSWTVTGTHAVEVTATNGCGQVGDTFTVTVFCQEVEGLEIGGPSTVIVDRPWTYQALPRPITASLPLTFTWDGGAVGPSAAYSWTLTGTYTLAVSATNVCGGVREAFLSVQVLEEWPYRLYLPLVVR